MYTAMCVSACGHVDDYLVVGPPAKVKNLKTWTHRALERRAVLRARQAAREASGLDSGKGLWTGSG